MRVGGRVLFVHLDAFPCAYRLGTARELVIMRAYVPAPVRVRVCAYICEWLPASVAPLPHWTHCPPSKPGRGEGGCCGVCVGTCVCARVRVGARVCGRACVFGCNLGSFVCVCVLF